MPWTQAHLCVATVLPDLISPTVIQVLQSCSGKRAPHDIKVQKILKISTIPCFWQEILIKRCLLLVSQIYSFAFRVFFQGSSNSPSAAYALEWLGGSYVGPTFQVRRASDSSIVDIFAHQDGSFWTSLDDSGQLLDDWLNGDTAYCSVWYDQSGAGNHATQVIAGLQPEVNYTNLLMDFTAQGGSAYFNLPPGTVPENVPYTVTVKHGVINNPTGGWLGGGNTAINQCNNFRRDGAQYVNYWWSNDFDAGSYAPGNVVTFLYDGLSTEYCYINSDLASSIVKQPGWDGQAGNEYLGNTIFGGDGALNGEIGFLYIFKSALKDSTRLIFEHSMPGVLGV